MLKNWLEKYIVAWAVQQLTIDNLKLVLSRCLEYLKVKAYQSEMKLDDWAIEILESIVADDEKMLVLYNWIMTFIPKTDGICRAFPNEPQMEELASQLMNAGENSQVCKSIPIVGWETLLEMIIPFLVEYWRKEAVGNRQ